MLGLLMAIELGRILRSRPFCGDRAEGAPAKGSAPKKGVLNYACDFRFAGNPLEQRRQTG